MKRIFIILISLCAVISAYADDDVIEIWNKAQLETFRDAVNGGNTYSGKTVNLMADITIVADDHWIPIGMSEQRWDEEHLAYVKDETCVFKGTFDGQGNTITITVSSNHIALGLFGYLYGTVQHLKVAGNITNTSTLTSSTAGIAGYNRGTISECANLAYIVGTTAGGIAGENHGTITNCYNQGSIGATGNFDGDRFLGGIAGAIDGEKATISNVYASCSIEDYYTGLTGSITNGGIVANPSKWTSSTCYYNVKLNGDTEMDGNTTLTGNALKSSFDNSKWTFTDGELPELTCFKNKIVRLSDNNDNSDILTSYNNQTCTVELSGRTLYKDGKWNTLCLPFDVDDISSSPLAGATIKEMDGTKTNLDSNGKLTLKFNTATSIEAGKPYIIMWEPGTDLDNVQFSGVTIDNTGPTPVTFSNAFGGDGQFVGTYSPFGITSGNIDEIVLLSDANKLGYSKNPRTLRSCRAHFMIPTSSSGIRAMVDFDIDFNGGESTGVAALNDNGEMIHDNDGWYTLTGVKLDGKPTRRGIYLHNGRKEAVQ